MSKLVAGKTKARVISETAHHFKRGSIVTYVGVNPFGGTNFKGVPRELHHPIEQWLSEGDYEVID